MAAKRIEYMCSQCGKKETRYASLGRPNPGKCPRKQGRQPPYMGSESEIRKINYKGR